MFDAIVNVLILAALMGLGGIVFVVAGMFIAEVLGFRDD